MAVTKEYTLLKQGSNVAFGGATGRVDLYIKYNSQSIANNNTNYSIQARLVVSGGYIGEYTKATLTLTGDGISSTQNLGTGNFTSRTLGEASGTIAHNSDGNKRVDCTAKVTFSAWGKSVSAYNYIQLPTIPRYFTSTPTITLASKTETSQTFNWTTSETCSQIQVYKAGSLYTTLTPNAKSGSFTVSGMSANTSYAVYGVFKRSDSGLTTNSNTLTNTTYNYPYVTSAPNFTIGNSNTITFYNPLKRNCAIYLTLANGSQYGGDTTTGTTISGYNGTTWQNNLYNSIPNAKSGTYKVRLVCSALSRDTTVNGGTYSINDDVCKPTFSNFTYQDTDSRTLALTGNSQILVDGKSDCVITISSANKAVGRNGASISKYICYWGSTSAEGAYSSSDVNVNLYDKSGNTLKVTAVDSRGLSTTVTKTITNIPYVNAVINGVSTERVDGINAETYLGFSANIWNGKWNASTDENYSNKLKYVGYRVLIDGAWSEYYDITDIVLSNISQYSSGSSTSITLNTSSRINIHKNGSSGGFEVGKQFTIELLIKDGNNNSTFTPYSYVASKQGTVTDGKIGMSRYKDSNGNYHYGINGMADANYTERIFGDLKADGYIQPKGIAAHNSRLSSADFEHQYPHDKVSERLDISSSSMTTHKPPSADGYIKTFMWDNSGAYDAQIAISHNPTALNHLCLRGRNNGDWGNWKTLLDMIYPVGSIYMNWNSTNPGTLFGGTWERLSGGYLYGCVNSSGKSTITGTTTGASSGSTGGPSNNTSGSTTLTTNQIPSHTHPHYVRAIYQYKNGDTGAVRGSYESGATTAATGATGGGQGHTHGLSSHTHSLNSHTHDVPYIAVFVWRRTA